MSKLNNWFVEPSTNNKNKYIADYKEEFPYIRGIECGSGSGDGRGYLNGNGDGNRHSVHYREQKTGLGYEYRFLSGSGFKNGDGFGCGEGCGEGTFSGCNTRYN